MDVKTFATDLLNSLSEISAFDQISLQSEGPVVSGYAYPDEAAFSCVIILTKLPAPLLLP